MKKLIVFFTIVLLLQTIASVAQVLETIPNVDLEKYSGKWYEIASYPTGFQKRCHCTTATYTTTTKGYVIVENRCNRDSINGKESYIRGKAFVVANSGNAKLKIQFFWPFKGKYWIVDLADDYSYAVVDNPNGKYLWILSRTPTMEKATLDRILLNMQRSGFDTSKLRLTAQK